MPSTPASTSSTRRNYTFQAALMTILTNLITTIAKLTTTLSTSSHAHLNRLLWQAGWGAHGPLPGTLASHLQPLLTSLRNFPSVLSDFFFILSSLTRIRACVNSLANRSLWLLGYGPLGIMPGTLAFWWHATSASQRALIAVLVVEGLAVGGLALWMYSRRHRWMSLVEHRGQASSAVYVPLPEQDVAATRRALRRTFGGQDRGEPVVKDENDGYELGGRYNPIQLS